MAQLLINDAESAIAEANPRIDPAVSGAAKGVSVGLTPSQREANYEMRTAAAVWADKRDAVEAEVPTRGGDLGSHHQSMMR